MTLLELIETLQTLAHPLTQDASTVDPLAEMIGNARFVLIGEASHGTHEFYARRAALTQHLIQAHGFNAVAAEADFPDAYRVNCYVHETGDDATPERALGDFVRFPAWMWRNTVMRDFVQWLRGYNQSQPRGVARVGFYGLDLYSLHRSMHAVIDYLDTIDPDAAARARYRYGCFNDFGEDPQAYGYAASIGMSASCQSEVLNQLLELQRKAAAYVGREGRVPADAYWFAEQNARLAMNAEAYYRSIFEGRASSWNLRDTHMAETLDSLAAHLERQHGRAKIVVWAHNSHLGDARATDMSDVGEVNLGQLVRECHGDETRLIGFSTYTGTVTAASDWDMPPERKWVRPALPESYEHLFHQVGIPQFMLLLRDSRRLWAALQESRLQRAIGVIYRPQTERISHYFYTRLPEQFDALLHLDETRALEPLERTGGWDAGEMPDTFPTGV